VTRAEIFADFELHAVKLDHGLAFHTDADLEAAHLMWMRAGSPEKVVIGVAHSDEGIARPWIDAAVPCQEESPSEAPGDLFANLASVGK
jgi:hypothetical protein